MTGRDGQLARSLIERAAELDSLTLVALGRPGLDLERPESIGPAIREARPDLVINAAAYTAVDQAEDEPERAFRINCDAAGEVAAAAAAAGAPIIQISTDYVFDGRSNRAYAEDAQTNPLGVYGNSKLAGEEAVRRANLDHLIVRTAWVYSPFGRNFLKTMMAAAERMDAVRVVADQKGNPTSALDLADGLLSIPRRWQEEKGVGLGNTYHLAGVGEASWAGFALAIFESYRATGLRAAQVVPIRTADWPTRAARPANSMLDSSRFDADFRFQMPLWRSSVTRTVERLAAEREPARFPDDD